jgi:hypothetical protein
MIMKKNMRRTSRSFQFIFRVLVFLLCVFFVFSYFDVHIFRVRAIFFVFSVSVLDFIKLRK